MLEGRPVLARRMGTVYAPHRDQDSGEGGSLSEAPSTELGIWVAYDPNNYMKNVKKELVSIDRQLFPLD